MSRVEDLAAEAQTYPVKFMEVTRVYAKSPGILVCLFEGEDEKYFSCRLSIAFGGDGWKGINSGGRSSVLQLHNLLSEHVTYKGYRFAGFVDNDYDEPFDNPDPETIYVTPCYSVENLYASSVCLRNILSAEFKVSEQNELSAEYESCLGLFNTRFEEVCEALLEFNSWAKSRTIQEENGEPPIKLFLNDATIDMLVHLDLNGCTVIYDKNNIKSVFKKADPNSLCQKSVDKARASFVPEKRCYLFRGKQQLAAFGLFLKSLNADFTSGGGVIFNKKRKLKTDLASEDADLMSELSQYAETPDCLRMFLVKQAVPGNSGIIL
ncbi:hypothetical protein B0F86_18690 [Pseudomonas syringae]|uniref:DUF4435 domain-containing protein n=1 Tax=Pseudomonas syringae TaxID=317 RepID=UPI000CEEE9F2|nr:DUF4435 domain-containing protein [Pseudomonas syringae]PPS39383.1 hypothetical protein B0F86_18690 [Pseudomonas syringae]